ncbi:hypothetical protein VP01_1728g3 [Puccinia sorghi]|uniref:Uncharacterized protein n=1 Tax=Puccinia sorghi TaxID=27349 RepID=A0A0L6VFF2_9BASI|nr:hypothetical protein VP01_1728g3 [Puccinia sorghi]
MEGILTHMLDYSLETQCNLFFELAVIHNFSVHYSDTKGKKFFDLNDPETSG